MTSERPTRWRDGALPVRRAARSGPRPRGRRASRDRRVNTALAWLGAVLFALSVGPGLCAQFEMPDPKQMSGIPRPVTDLPDGTVSIRLIRGDLSKNIANHPVELRAGAKVLTQNTDESGRAQFSGLTAGAALTASAVVDGERLESREFPAPDKGGIRLMLVATDTSKGPATTPGAAAIAGEVVIGNQSRLVVEPGEDGVQVFYLLDISNTARAPVNPSKPFAFDMPAGAVGTTIMDGSSPLASATGTRVTVLSPIPPGHTFVQVASELPATNGAVTIRQTFPAGFEQLAVVVKKVGATTVRSAQITEQRELPADGGMFIAATGGTVAAGQAITIEVAGFPHHSTTPRTVALALSVVIVCIGVWGAGQTEDDSAGRAVEHKRLVARRERLFNDLVKLENDRRSGRADPRRYETRHEELVAALEHVYSALDDEGAGLEPADRAGQPAPLDRLGAA